MNHFNAVAFAVLLASFLIVTCVGFASARWRPAEDPMQLNEWGLGGRGFGTFVSWFLLGGDIYTAYTLIAVPALAYATGASGFYALSSTIMVFPIVFIFAPRLWSVARARGYVSPGEFVRGRHGSQGLGLAVAVTYIAITALILNLIVSALLTVVFRWIKMQDGYDETRPGDYSADPIDPPAVRAGPTVAARSAAALDGRRSPGAPGTPRGNSAGHRLTPRS